MCQKRKRTIIIYALTDGELASVGFLKTERRNGVSGYSATGIFTVTARITNEFLFGTFDWTITN